MRLSRVCRIYISLFALFIAMSLALGCDIITTIPRNNPKDPPDWQEPETPEILINDLSYTYNEADYVKYAELLHEDFVFYFDDTDVGGEIPASWGYQEELDATERLFETALAHNIKLDLVIPDDYEDSGEHEDQMWVNDVAYDLQVTIDDTTYKAIATANFNCVVDGAVDSGEDRWRFLYWYDIVD